MTSYLDSSASSSESCDHCLTSLKAELIQVPGIVGVDIKPSDRKVSILTDGPVDERLIREAMDLAGCEFVEERYQG
jgi:copper chaperone CopZ